MTGLLKRMIGQGLAVAEPEPAPAADLHRENRWRWAEAQIDALVGRDPNRLDWDSLIAEVRGIQDDMASGLKKRFGRAAEHLLKIQHTDYADSYLVWEKDCMKARWGMVAEIESEPDLLEHLEKTFDAGWKWGRARAVGDLARHAGERGENAAEVAAELRRLIPKTCPWSIREVAGCDLWDEEPVPDNAVIPAEIRDRLCGEGITYPYREERRPLKRDLLAAAAEARGGKWVGLLNDVSDDKDSAGQRAGRQRDKSMVELARDARRDSEQRGGGGRGR